MRVDDGIIVLGEESVECLLVGGLFAVRRDEYQVSSERVDFVVGYVWRVLVDDAVIHELAAVNVLVVTEEGGFDSSVSCASDYLCDPDGEFLGRIIAWLVARGSWLVARL